MNSTMENSSEINLPQLPESCISDILSFTTPRDLCRLSAVSRLFTSAADGDSLWNKFIPQQSHQILPRAVTPVAFASRRELYFHLCNSILIDRGTQRFWLERSTAKIAYMLYATELSIKWGNDQRYWNWVSIGDSRFRVLAELIMVWWFDVSGRIDCRLLSVNTQYRVVFVLKFAQRSYGWSALPIMFSVTGPDGQESESSRVFMKRKKAHKDPNEEELEKYDEDNVDGVDYIFYDDDDWIEVVAGAFTVTASEGEDDPSHMECKFSMREVESNNQKAGLFLDGVRIEPVNSTVGV
jgi:hypothetical protein